MNPLSPRLYILVVIAAVIMGVFGNPAACLGAAWVVRALLRTVDPP